MSVSLLKRSHEDFFLQPGYLLALQFNQGWIVFRILGWEHTNIKPYRLDTNLAGTANSAAWDEIIDAQARRLLEPTEEHYIYQAFWGVTPRKVRIYFQYPTRRDRNSLAEITRVLGGDIGYIDGDMSPYDGPFSKSTELFTVHDLYPAFRASNPLSYNIPRILLNFDIMRYRYELIKDKALIKDILLQRKTSTKHTIGGIDPSPGVAPDWLVRVYGKDLIEYSVAVMEGRE